MKLLKPLRTNAKSHVLDIRFCNDWFGDGLKILPFPGYSQVTMKRNLTERGKPMKIPDFSGVFYSPRLACTTWNQEDISKKKWHPYKETMALTPPTTIAFPIHIPKEKEKSSPSSNHQLSLQVIFVKKTRKLSRGTTLELATQEMSPVARPYRCLSFHPIAPALRADGWSRGSFPESVLERKEATPNATWRFGNPEPWEASKMLARGHVILNLLACLLMHMDLSFISSKHSMDSLGQPWYFYLFGDLNLVGTQVPVETLLVLRGKSAKMAHWLAMGGWFSSRTCCLQVQEMIWTFCCGIVCIQNVSWH